MPARRGGTLARRHRRSVPVAASGGTVARAEEAHDDVHSDRGWTTWTRPRAAALCRLRRVRDGLSLVFCSILFQIEMNFLTFPLQ